MNQLKSIGDVNQFLFTFAIFGLFYCLIVGCDSRAIIEDESNPVDSQSNNIQIRQSALPHTLSRVEQRQPTEGDWFEQIVPTGITSKYSDGNLSGNYTILETVGGGVAILDFDQDGDLDLFFPGGGEIKSDPLKVIGLPSSLYRNEGNWKFTDATYLLGDQSHSIYSHGASVADFNNDGFPDIFMTGFQGCKLFKNNEGKGFTEISREAGILIDSWTTASAWLDYDRDGDLDLYVASYCVWDEESHSVCTQRLHDGTLTQEPCGPTQYPGKEDYFWENQGDLSFKNVSEYVGLTAKHRGLGVLVADFDLDGWSDIYVANDVDENDLYYGRPNGKFESMGVLSGVALSMEGNTQGSMGIDICDINHNGFMDIFYTNFVTEDNSLLRQIDKRLFVNVSEQYGVPRASRRWVGFGAILRDFNADGWSDLVVSNGHVFYNAPGNPYFQPPQLFQNMSGKTFNDVSNQGGPYFSGTHAGRGIATGDLDNDGMLDLVFVNQNAKPVLLRNNLPSLNWTKIKLQGTTSNSDAIGASLLIRTNDTKERRWQSSGNGYLSHSDSTMIIRLLDGSEYQIEVLWPSGKIEVFENLIERVTNVLSEGEGTEIEQTN